MKKIVTESPYPLKKIEDKMDNYTNKIMMDSHTNIIL